MVAVAIGARWLAGWLEGGRRGGGGKDGRLLAILLSFRICSISHTAALRVLGGALRYQAAGLLSCSWRSVANKRRTCVCVGTVERANELLLPYVWVTTCSNLLEMLSFLLILLTLVVLSHHAPCFAATDEPCSSRYRLTELLSHQVLHSLHPDLTSCRVHHARSESTTISCPSKRITCISLTPLLSTSPQSPPNPPPNPSQ